MLVYNTMRFGTDVFTVTDSGGQGDPVIGFRGALLDSGDYLDATDASAVIGFNITGIGGQNTKRSIMFALSDEDHFWRFVDGVLTAYTGNLSFETVLAEGNTPEELNALTDLSALVGKRIYPIIAIQSWDANINPTVKIALDITSQANVVKTKTVNSAQFDLPSPSGVTPKIVNIVPNTTLTGGGNVNITVRLKTANNTWSEYMTLANAANQNAVAVQFKIVYSVANVGSDSAKVNSIAVNYTANSDILSGDVAELFSIIPNFETDLRLCYLVVRHKKLIDSQINAFANFFPTPKHRERILIGVGTDDTVTYTLGVNGVPDSQIDHSSIKIFVDGVQTSNFDYNTETSELTINATADKSILASYDYDCGVEEWRPMDVEFFQQPYRDGTYMTRFSYVLPDEIQASRANIRLQFLRPSGSVTNLSLGIATGKTQQIVLPHVAKTDSIQLNADFTYDFDTRVLTFVAPEGTELIISYDWLGEKHKIYSWAAGWSAA